VSSLRPEIGFASRQWLHDLANLDVRVHSIAVHLLDVDRPQPGRPTRAGDRSRECSTSLVDGRDQNVDVVTGVISADIQDGSGSVRSDGARVDEEVSKTTTTLVLAQVADGADHCHGIAGTRCKRERKRSEERGRSGLGSMEGRKTFHPSIPLRPLTHSTSISVFFPPHHLSTTLFLVLHHVTRVLCRLYTS
jgi:hypothetical protein